MTNSGRQSFWPGLFQRLLRYSWLVVLLVMGLVSVLAYHHLKAQNEGFLQKEFVLRSQNIFDAIRSILRQHIDATHTFEAFIWAESKGRRYLDSDELRAFSTGFLKGHPKELNAIVIMPPVGHGGVRVLRQDGGLIASPWDKRWLATIKAGKSASHVLRGQEGRWLLRFAYALSGEAASGHIVLDWDLDSMFDTAMSNTRALGVNLIVDWLQGQQSTLIYALPEHQGSHGALNPSLVWQKTLTLSANDFVIQTRASPMLIAEVADTGAIRVLALGLSLSLLLSFLVRNRFYASERLQTIIQKRTHEIQAQQREMASLVDHARESILLIDEAGGILRANPAACDLFAYPEDVWPGLRVHDLVPKEICTLHKAWFREEVDGKRSDVIGKTRSSYGRKSDGSTFPCELTVTRFQGDGQHYLSVILREITEQIRREWAMNTLLELRKCGQKPIPMHTRLKEMLVIMLSEPWGITQGSGVVFLLHKQEFWLTASQGWSLEDKRRYITVPVGQCLCGQVCPPDDAIFSPHAEMAHRHDTSGHQDLDHLDMPLFFGEERLGVISLVLKLYRPLPEPFVQFCHDTRDIVADMVVYERVRRALSDSVREYQMLLERTPIGIIIHVQSKVVYANQSIVNMMHMADREDLMGRYVLDFVVEEDRGLADKRIQALQQGEGVEPLEERLLRPDGSRFWAEVRGLPVLYEDQPAVQLLIDDITTRKEAEERLTWLSYYDDLTQIANRRLLHERLEQMVILARRHHHHLAVLFLDLNRFKTINDTLGHEFGDYVLKTLAARLVETLRTSDTVARLGGDEFCLLLPETDSKSAIRVARKFQQMLTEPICLDKKEIVVSASIGLSVFPDDGEDSQTLLKHADSAMFYAKKQHLALHCFTPSIESAAVRVLRLEQEMLSAIDHDQFCLHYQPKHRLSDDALTSVESLIRWSHPDLGRISPAEFIPVAEDAGLIGPVTRWVIHQAALQARSWEDAGIRPGRVGINVSAVRMTDKGFAQEILGHIREVGANPEWLDMEVTETAAMHDPDAVIRMMRQLVDQGITISIDDFGTGYSSLAYLKRLPVETLKIDMSFIRGLPGDADDVAIVRSTIGLAHTLGMKVLAEGVENQAQLEWLRREGCDEAQGYWFSKPLPASDFVQYHQSHDFS